MSQVGEQTDSHKTGIDFIPSEQWGKENSTGLELVRDNLLEIKKNIAPCKSKIIGVTKYFGTDAITNAYKAGLRDFGESRAIDAIKKVEQLPSEIQANSTFHFIGHLQSNKADKVVRVFDYIHSIDSVKIAQAVSEAACRINKREKVLLQVNNAGEEQKFGYSKEQLLQDMPKLLEFQNIEIIGLMNIAPLYAKGVELRSLFRDIRKFRDELETKFSIELPELSMGMSNDYTLAAEEGSTMIRIGRKLFT